MTHIDPLSGLVATTAALKSALETIRVQGKGARVYEYDPGMPDQMPCIVMSLPELQFPDMDEPQTQMGTYDLNLLWPVTIYVNATDLKYAHATAQILMAGVTAALEDDQTLNQVAEDMRIISARPQFVFNADGSNPRLVVECTLHGYIFIND